MAPLELLFWFSLMVTVYAYVGYPVILRALSRFRKVRSRVMPPDSLTDELPRVSLLISAYNEESVIEAKIINSLSLSYPRDLVEIVVISDGSLDTTEDIVARYADRGVVLRANEGRRGKTACLNMAVPLARGEIIVFSDANSEYDRDSLREMVRHFRDREIGFVTGWTKYRTGNNDACSGSLDMYARLELLSKKYESMIGSCVGADGAIFAIRKELFRPLNTYDINDFVIPLAIVQQGFRGVLEERAFCFENTAGSAHGEFHRQVRISSRTIRAVMNNSALLNPWKYGIFSFELFSHKLCRFLVPVFLIVLFMSSLLLGIWNYFYLTAFVGQIVFYTAAGFFKVIEGKPILSKVLEVSHAFVMLNLAISLAWIKYSKGATYVTWSPIRR